MLNTIDLHTFLTLRGYTNQINEGLYDFLQSQGQSGQLNEMFYNWLGQLGYEGTLNERVYQWSKDGMAASFSKLSGDTYPAAPQSLPANLMPQPAGEFGSAAGWTTHDGLTIDTVAGLAKWDGSSIGGQPMFIPLTDNTVTGHRYGFLTALTSRSVGSIRPELKRVGQVTTPKTGPLSSVGYHSRQGVSNGVDTQGQILVSAGAVLDIDFLRIYDIDELLEKKWRIVFVYSQSNWIGPHVTVVDAIGNDFPEARAIAIPSSQRPAVGAYLDSEGIGEPMLLTDPVQHLTGNPSGGPSGAFARTFCDGLRDDEVLVYVATGYWGGSRLAPDGVWNREVGGEAWLNMLKQVDAMVSRAPEGSTVAGMLFCQGEADRGINVADEHATAIRGDIKFLRNRWGLFPVVINEIGLANTSGSAGTLIASQAKLDSGSGDPLSIPLCRYIPRPNNSTFLADNVHYDQPTQRVRGASAATALLELNYGGPA